MLVLYLRKLYLIKLIRYKNIQMECGEPFYKKVACLHDVIFISQHFCLLCTFNICNKTLIRKPLVNISHIQLFWFPFIVSCKQNINPTEVFHVKSPVFSFLPPANLEIFTAGFSTRTFIFPPVHWLKKSDYSSPRGASVLSTLIKSYSFLCGSEDCVLSIRQILTSFSKPWWSYLRKCSWRNFVLFLHLSEMPCHYLYSCSIAT